MKLSLKFLVIAACLEAVVGHASDANAQSAASAFTSAIRYDNVGRVTGTIAPDPDGTGPIHYAAARNTYDAAGRLMRVEKGELATWQSEAVAPVSWSGLAAATAAEIVQLEKPVDVFSRHRMLVTASRNTGRKGMTS
jgi:hypothetical protein